jgi:hypothetical protein
VGQEVVKRSGRDEPMWVNTQVHGSNSGNLFVKLSLSQTSKNDMSFLLSLMFSLQNLGKKRVEHVLPGKEGEVAQTMYIHESKCKISQIKRKKDKKKENLVFICKGILLNHEEE